MVRPDDDGWEALAMKLSCMAWAGVFRRVGAWWGVVGSGSEDFARGYFKSAA